MIRLKLLTLGTGLLCFLAATLASGEIYQWTDSNGRVHYSDKRAAKGGAVVVGEEVSKVTDDGFLFTFPAQADALISSNNSAPQGKSSVLSTGYWRSNATNRETRSLLQFDIGPLLKELNTQTHKKLRDAYLELYANTQDKIYGQGITNRESPGHSTRSGDNAFYLKPVRNNWDETTVTWASFYDPSYYTPKSIRTLPTVSVPGSDGVPDKNYRINVTELVSGLLLTQQREVTLELSPQRVSSMAQVTFFSREAEDLQTPKLIVNLK